MSEHYDVIIVGAGLSGITAAYHLQKLCPGKSFVVLEGRSDVGGTWDLFRYPGIRSDSDMFTLGFRWKPWLKPKGIAAGQLIQDYVREAAHEQGIHSKIRFQERVTQASWSTDKARWTLDVQSGSQNGGSDNLRYSCNFLYMCSGYYDYEQGYAPQFEGQDQFAGRIVHPQHWTSDVDYAGKRVVVIGSGATAVTLVPALAEKAANVVMLQRSPSYVVAFPAQDPIANFFRKKVSPMNAYRLTRWKNIGLGAFFYNLARRNPDAARKRIVDGVKEALGPNYDVAKHFNPRYSVWDQRVCIVPDGDLFQAVKSGRAEVVTDEIERFTPQGVQLRSGRLLEADLVVTATGLEMKLMGGVSVTVDGRPFEVARSLSYKGCMFTDLPNAAYSFGYFNASWTLKADLIAEYVCRLLGVMAEKGASYAVPRNTEADGGDEPFVHFSSGYVKRALGRVPRQGAKHPFKLYQNYLKDIRVLRFGRVDDGFLQFGKPVKQVDKPVPEQSAQAEL
ncbi:MAG TPA: NAD(P)/FAD-dependent oxidoreductase [Polyangiales bacterium]|nr:NAD(P)/FAD-dependent oxidoreductase [Polyangiales bacterium]